MISKISSVLVLSLVLVNAETPQENSHAMIVNDARNILHLSTEQLAKMDPTQALLSNEVVSQIAQSVGIQGDLLADPNCMQQNLADLCLKTAKQLKMDKQALAACIMYRSLERNTGGVGVASGECHQPVQNQEIASIKQHQDPAAEGAQEWNTQVEIHVAKALKGLGLTDNQAVLLTQRTATFPPGDPSDQSGRGNSCDSFPSFRTFGEAVPDVWATIDGQRDSQGVSGVVFGRKITAGQWIDCTTLAELTNSTIGRMMPAIQPANLLSLLAGTNAAAHAAPGIQSQPAAPAVNPPQPSPSQTVITPIPGQENVVERTVTVTKTVTSTMTTTVCPSSFTNAPQLFKHFMN